MELIFGTQNDNKVEEIIKLIPPNFLVKSLSELNFETEIDESGATLEENALIKARVIFNTFKKDCFADDSGLEVNVLFGKPGVYSARYAGNQKNSQDNMDKLLYELRNEEDRKAQFRTVIALILNGSEYLFEGVVKGEIIYTQRGEKGFGYDPIFAPEKHGLTFAQMSLSQKNKISHRSKAFQKLVQFLKSKI
ncbi:MAG: non-canonical purine NTP pyrophosphatase, RdgB/HAM1 family [Flavobacteriaceae bacterium TMED171]|nr:non-canonical purine NTP pyrophosphatase, RdgB/HAM1 family [Flavobacteriaceae bacterium]OUW31189.1 MAG: non-canonical purine NTP pyrophosphatase, RdgB/HAM1 family [Flavobacteriaceae bacterium TMED171]|tara:strand:+ start:1790 stop:2368 length:579 start_codon:yes stop_codon:yes gene_type:complete